MADSTLEFYNLLADEYHLIFDDWERSIERQAGIIDQFIQHNYHKPPDTLSVLDCSCGIGTQAIIFWDCQSRKDFKFRSRI